MFRGLKRAWLGACSMILLTLGGYAQESTTPSVDIVLEVAQDGGIEAGFNDTDPLVDGNGTHTAGMDGPNGEILAGQNGVVRTFDAIRYGVHWSVNDVDSATDNNRTDGTVDDVTITIDTGREDVRWIYLPEVCDDGSEITDGMDVNTTLICKLGTKAEGTIGTISPVAKVYQKANGETSNTDVIQLHATIDSAQTEPKESNEVQTTISAKPSGDWIKSDPDFYYHVANGDKEGVVLVYPITFRAGDSDTGIVGTDPLDDTFKFEFYDHAWDLGEDAIFATEEMMSDLNRSQCGGYDGRGSFPYGDDGTLPDEATSENTTHSFDLTCTDVTGDGSSGENGDYPMVKLEIENYSTRVFPPKNANGTTNKENTISLQVAFWVSNEDIEAKTSDENLEAFWNTINGDNDLDSTDADTEEDVLPYTDPIQVGVAGGGSMDESTIGDNSVSDTGLTVDDPLYSSGGEPGSTSVDRVNYKHHAIFFPGPYQQVYSKDPNTGLDYVAFDSREVASEGQGSIVTPNWIGTGGVSRSEMVTLQFGLFATTQDSTSFTSDPVHLCGAIDNRHMDIVNILDSFERHEVADEVIAKSSKTIDITTGLPNAGIANITFGDRIGMSNMWWVNKDYPYALRTNPNDLPAYVIEVTNAPLDINHSEHALTCSDSDAGDAGWINIEETDTLQDKLSSDATPDINGYVHYDKITRVRVRMLERRFWTNTSESNQYYNGVGYLLHMQARIRPNVEEDPDGTEIYIHASRARGDWNATSGNAPLNTDCTKKYMTNDAVYEFEQNLTDTGWCVLEYNSSNEESYDDLLTTIDPHAFELFITDDNDDDGLEEITSIRMSHSDKITITGSELSVTKKLISPIDTLLKDGDLATFKISTYITGSPDDWMSSVFLQDDLPSEFEFVSATPPVDRDGNVLPNDSENYVNCYYKDNWHKYYCSFTKGYDSSNPIENYHYRASPFYAEFNLTLRVKDPHANDILYNRVEAKANRIENGEVSSTQIIKNAYAAAPIVPRYNELNVRKNVPDLSGECLNGTGAVALDSKTVLEGDCSRFSVDGVYAYDLEYTNNGNDYLSEVTIIDTLPFNGDTNESGAGDGRTPQSSFSGTSTLRSIETSDAGAVIECTTDDPLSINRDPELNTNSWSTTCDENATAFRVVESSPIDVGEKRSIHIELQTSGNRHNDIYTNTFGARTHEIMLPARSNDVSAMVQALSIGSTVFEDKNNNSAQDSDEIGIADVQVNLYKDGIYVATTTTNAEGDYLFDNLGEGNYTVTVIPPSNLPYSSKGNGEDDQIDGDDNGIQNSAGEETNSSVIALSLGDEPTTNENAQGADLDADSEEDAQKDANGDMTIDFGFYQLGSISGAVREDINHNGLLSDSVDRPIAGVTISLYLDLNGNGIIDSDDVLVATTITDSNGLYSFTDLEPANYLIQETQPDGYEDVTDSDENSTESSNLISASVRSGETDTANDFVEVGTGSWSGNVGEDLDKNGTADRGIAGVTLELYIDEDGNGELNSTELENGAIATVTTDENGDYNITQLAPLGYVIVEIQPEGFVDVGENEGGADNDAQNSLPNQIAGVISPDESDLENDFVERGVNALGSTVWLDENANGLLDADEVGIAGVRVELLDSNGSLVEYNLTDANGNYYFGYLGNGTYQVRIPTPPEMAPKSTVLPVMEDNGVDGDNNGMQATLNGEVLSPPITLTYNQEPTEESLVGSDLDDAYESSGDMSVDFGFISPMSLGSTLWLDQNNNGIMESDEAGIAGVRVELLDLNGTLIDSNITDAMGNYFFNDLPEGSYVVRIPTPPAEAPMSSSLTVTEDNGIDGDDNGIQSSIGSAVFSPVIELIAGEEPTDEPSRGGTLDNNLSVDANGDMSIDFGFFSPVSIGSTVWLDSNNDGLLNGEEVGIAGVSVELRDENNVTLDTNVTDANGNYLFSGLVEGHYYVVIPTVPEQAPLSSTQTVTEDNGVDNDDNGIQLESGGVVTSPLIELVAGAENNSSEDDSHGGDLDNALIDANGEMTIDFGFIQLGAWQGLVTEDINHNGLLNDEEDRPIAGVTISLYLDRDGDGILDQEELDAGPVAVTVTDASGSYLFEDLIPASYIAVETQPAGYADVTEGTEGGNDSDDNTSSVTNTIAGVVSSGETDTANDFVEVGTGSWSGNVGEDLDKNGTADRGIAGVTLELYIDEDGNGELNSTELENGAIATVTTDENGDYNITQLAPLGYVIVEIQPEGFVDVGENEGGADNDAQNSLPNQIAGVITPDESDLENDFVERGVNALGSTVWLDENANGLLDADEVGIAGVRVELLDSNGSLVEYNLTDANGNYYFGYLGNGTYQVRIPTPPEMAPKSTVLPVMEDNGVDGDNNGMQATLNGEVLSPPITLTYNQEPTEESLVGSDLDDAYESSGDMSVDFGFFGPARLGDWVWYDSNNNGIQESDELGVESVVVYLADENGTYLVDAEGMPCSTQTDDQGYYLFDDLVSGVYRVIFDLETLPKGYGVTLMGEGEDSENSDADRTTGISPRLYLSSGDENLSVDMGIVQVGSIQGQVSYEGEGDLSGLAGVELILYDLNGTEVARTTTDESGYYQFDNLVPAPYIIREVQPDGYLDLFENEGGGEAEENATTTAVNEIFALVGDGEIDGGNDFVEQLALESTPVVVTTPPPPPVVTLPQAETSEPEPEEEIEEEVLPEYACVGNYIWEDSNRNGIQDEVASGVEGIEVTLYESDCQTIVGYTQSSAQGYYQFGELEPQTYCLEFAGMDRLNYQVTVPNRGESDLLDSDVDPSTAQIHTLALEATFECDNRWDMGLYEDTPVEALRVYDDLVPANPDDPTTRIAILDNDDIVEGVYVELVDLQAGEILETQEGDRVVAGTTLMTVTEIYVPNEGTWRVEADGTVTFTADPNFDGIPTPIYYVVKDENGNQSNIAQLAIVTECVCETYTSKSSVGMDNKLGWGFFVLLMLLTLFWAKREL